MSSKFTLSATAAAWLLIATHVLAGGPPMLCIPIDGVTADNAELCASRLETALGARVWRHVGRPGLRMLQCGEQWSAVVFLEQDVALSEIETALHGSGFSVPRDRLRLFGHVTLVIESPALPEQLKSDLGSLKYVRFSESNQEAGVVLATVDMPYPVSQVRLDRESPAWNRFQWTDFSSDPQNKLDVPATRDVLPGINDLAQVVAQHNAQLKDLRWNANWGCRPLGCVIAPEVDPVVSAPVTSN